MSTLDRISELQAERLRVLKLRDDLAHNLRLIKSLREDASPRARAALDKKHRETLYHHATADRTLSDLRGQMSRLSAQLRAEERSAAREVA